MKSCGFIKFSSWIIDVQTELLGPTSCDGGNSCCTKQFPCSQWEGDCDNNDECEDELVCGHNNCPIKEGLDWDQYDDCCTYGNFPISYSKNQKYFKL